MLNRTPVARAAAVLCVTFGVTLAANAQLTAGRANAPQPAPADASAAAAPLPASQRVNVIAYLSDPPLAAALAAARAPNAARKSVPWSAEQQRNYSQQLKARQAQVISGAQALGATVVAQLTLASNGVLMSIDAGQLVALSRVSQVHGVMLVEDAQIALPTTTAYVGADVVRSRNPSIDGTGIRIAIIDSGIDFTHRNLGGAGTQAAYLAAYGAPAVTGAGAVNCQPTAQNTAAPTFNSKVVGGFDFVGENWPNTALQPDPNPIDCGGHGTHVADITAGRSADGLWKGMAPGAELYAVKVCSAVSPSCSGLAILQGLDYALDPNGDGDLSDAVDVVNMSLGANYGQRENPSSSATQNVISFGTVVVASAGNGGDVPYINGSPSSAPESIAVAQTQVTGQFAYPLLTSAGNVTNTSHQAWSDPITADISGPLAVDTNLTNGGCNPYAAGLFSGKIALISRGICAASIKTANATNAGAVGVVISDNVAAADPPNFSFGGGGTSYESTITITQAAGNALRTAVAGGPVSATISFSGRISLNGSMVSSSSRGPNPGYSFIKPDIGAPGGSRSAQVGTGSVNTAFSGTSGAAPVVAGASALVLQAHPSLQPHEVKARLMGGADNQVFTSPARVPGELAPVTRIGAGELRVVPAIDNQSVMWDAVNPGATSLSFGYQPTSTVKVLRKRVVVRNYSGNSKTYAVASSFRYNNDAASGGVTISAPASVSVPAHSSTAFTVQMTINPTSLPVWEATGVNGGQQGANGALLAAVEYDGYLTLTSGAEKVRLPWHVLPRRSHQGAASANVTLSGGSGAATVSNIGGATTANADVFALTGTSPQLPYATLPGPGDSYAVIDLRAAGVRGVNVGGGVNSGVQFAVSRFDPVSAPNMNLTVRVFIDTNNDGIDDWQLTASRTTANQNVAFLQKLTGCVPASNCPSTGYFFTIADLNTSNWILTVPSVASYAGSNQTVVNPSAPFRFRVVGLDNYFTGVVTDTIGSMVHQLSLPKYVAAVDGFGIPVGVSAGLPISAPAGGAAASPSQSGLLLMWRDGMPGREASLVNVN